MCLWSITSVVLLVLVFDVVRVEVTDGKTTASPFTVVLPALVAELSVVVLYSRPIVVGKFQPLEVEMILSVVVGCVANLELNFVEVFAINGVDVHFSVVGSLVDSVRELEPTTGSN